MASHAASAESSPLYSRASFPVVAFRGIVDIGATGAPTVSRSPDAAFTVTRSAAGTYAITYPKGRRAWVEVSFLSAAKTVTNWLLTAIDATAGTAIIKTLVGMTDTDPASGNKVFITIHVEV